MAEFKKVLAATDGSEHGLSAVVTGAACAAKLGADFEIASIVEVLLMPPEYSPPGIDAAKYEPEFVKEARETAAEQAREAGVPDAPVHVRAGFTAQLVNKVAAESGADLIVVGGHPQPALARSLVGSTGRRIVYLADRPVLIASEPRREPFQRVLAAIDLSSDSREVLDVAGAIAGACGAALRPLFALEPLPLMISEAAIYDEAERARHAREQLEALLDSANLAPGVEGRMREGDAGHEILEEAQDWDADLLVVGSHGFGFFDRLLMGSTSLYVLRHCHRATLVVRTRRRSGKAGDR